MLLRSWANARPGQNLETKAALLTIKVCRGDTVRRVGQFTCFCRSIPSDTVGNPDVYKYHRQVLERNGMRLPFR